MTIFQLLVYSCISLLDFSGDLLSKQCRWDARAFYAQVQTCEKDGSNEIGHPIFSDVADDRRVEKYRCGQVSVRVE